MTEAGRPDQFCELTLAKAGGGAKFDGSTGDIIRCAHFFLTLQRHLPIPPAASTSYRSSEREFALIRPAN